MAKLFQYSSNYALNIPISETDLGFYLIIYSWDP